MIALDTETTGLDLYHSARPFFLTYTSDDQPAQFYDWTEYINPLTREISIPKGDIQEIRSLLSRVCNWSKYDEEIRERHTILTQNGKFDAATLNTIGISNWPWCMNHDSLTASHVLASNHKHDLGALSLEYLGVDIEPFETTLERAVVEARNTVRHGRLRNWKIAKRGMEELPSLSNARVKPWKADIWLPKRIALELGSILYPIPDPDCDHLWSNNHWFCEHCNGHHWHTVLQEYSNPDSECLIPLWYVLKEELIRRDLWSIYLSKKEDNQLAFDLEEHGVTINRPRTYELLNRFSEEQKEYHNTCTNIAKSYGYSLKMPDGAMNDNLKEFLFSNDGLNLPVVKLTDNNNPSFDKFAIEEYHKILPAHSMELGFILSLSEYRTRGTGISYLESYERFWLSHKVWIDDSDAQAALAEVEGFCNEWYKLHPSLNPTGTDTLRWSSIFFNEQNVSDKEGFSLRYAFGPAPGREWYNLDFKNVEKRIPAFESGDEDSIALLDRPNDPPYFGSEHLFTAHILWPKEFESCRNEKGELDGRIFKDRFKSLYKKGKNFNFATQYNCGESKGDETAGFTGAFRKVKARRHKQEELNQHWINFANKKGYVETLPDKTVNPRRGYPLLCSRTDRGDVLSTIPLAYHVSGTAMWITHKAMIRTTAHLNKIRKESKGTFDGFITMQGHDSLTFDLPKRADPRTDLDNGLRHKTSTSCSNLPLVRTLRELMEQGGDDVGIPTPVDIAYHPEHWATGYTLE